jgi:hypothetical protein
VGCTVGHCHLEERVGMARPETLAAEAALRLENRLLFRRVRR